jgi:glycosyltransferase involved in cell wall biosynthesis
MQSIRNTVERCGVEPYVRWVEYHLFEAMPKLYAAVDVVVSYPYDDAFPSTLIEAAACGNYIVATDLPTYQGTFLEHYSSLAAADDVPALAQALHEAGNASPEWRMARVEKAREVIAAEYKEEVTRDRLLQLYADVAQKS